MRIGTRGSPLALAQTRAVIAALAASKGWFPDEAAAKTEIVIIRTSGDRIQDRSLADIGGKGLFAREIEDALLAGSIDCAVHSLKDMPTVLPPGLIIDCVLPREDPRDAFIGHTAANLQELPQGAIVGTSSVRRQAILLNARPDLKIVLFRGNVETRLNRVNDGSVGATVLAMAGLNRLGRTAAASHIFSTGEMLPAIAQGAIGIETREGDTEIRDTFAPVNHLPTWLAVTMERAFLTVLDGSCKTPIAGLATFEATGQLSFLGCALSPDGTQRFDTSRIATVTSSTAASIIGDDAGQELLGRAGRAFFQV